MNLSSYDVTKGVATGSSHHMQIKLSGEGGCKAVIDGTSGTATDGKVMFTYTNRTASLKLAAGGNLHFYRVSNCSGLNQNDDPATLSAAFTMSPKQEITSP